MKSIEVDDQLYHYIASNTKFIGESASDILRRLLGVDDNPVSQAKAQEPVVDTVDEPVVQAVVVEETVKAEEIEPETPQVQISKTVKPSTKTDQSIFELINKEDLATQRGAVGRFLLILSNLYRVHQQKFSVVLDIRGRDRLYFATSEQELLKNGSSTKPKQIPEADFWVITNSNTTKKKLMLTDVATALGYSVEETEIIRDFL